MSLSTRLRFATMRGSLRPWSGSHHQSYHISICRRGKAVDYIIRNTKNAIRNTNNAIRNTNKDIRNTNNGIRNTGNASRDIVSVAINRSDNAIPGSDIGQVDVNDLKSSLPTCLKQITANNLPSLIRSVRSTEDMRWMINTRVIDYVILKNGQNFDQISAKHLLLTLLHFYDGKTRQAYCFRALPKLIQFQAHRLSLIDLLDIHRGLDSAFPDDHSLNLLRKAVLLGIKNQARDQAVTLSRSSAHFLRLLSLGCTGFASYRFSDRIKDVSMAVDAIKSGVFITDSELGQQMIATGRNFLIENLPGEAKTIRLKNQLYSMLQVIAGLSQVDPRLVRAAYCVILDDIENYRSAELLDMACDLCVYDERLMNVKDCDIHDRFKLHFSPLIDREFQDASITSQDASITSQDVSITSLDASFTSQDASITSQDASITSQDASITSQDASITSQDDSTTRHDASITSQDASITSQDASITSKDASITRTDHVKYIGIREVYSRESVSLGTYDCPQKANIIDKECPVKLSLRDVCQAARYKIVLDFVDSDNCVIGDDDAIVMMYDKDYVYDATSEERRLSGGAEVKLKEVSRLLGGSAILTLHHPHVNSSDNIDRYAEMIRQYRSERCKV